MKFQVTALNTYGEIITRKEKKKKKKVAEPGEIV